jgi:hypothetical protein
MMSLCPLFFSGGLGGFFGQGIALLFVAGLCASLHLLAAILQFGLRFFHEWKRRQKKINCVISTKIDTHHVASFSDKVFQT